MFKILFSLTLALGLMASDATIEIVKHIKSLPSIKIQSKVDKTLFQRKFEKVLVGDFKVSSNFDLLSSTQGKSDYILSYDLDERDSLIISVQLKGKDGVSYFNKKYRLKNQEKYPFLAHKIVIDINNLLKLPSIDWMDNLVVFSKYIGRKESQIVIADYTLTYKKAIIKNGLNLFPKWTDKSHRSFYYTSYSDFMPTLYKYDIYNGTKEKIVSSKGMLVCGDVSANGKKLLLTMTTNDQPDIYLYDTVTKRKQRVTKFKGIEVNANFVDNDSKVVFVSDLLGYPNIFSIGLNGQNFEQMVFHGKNNNTCSTHDKYVVYSSRETNSEFGRNTFNLYLMSTQTNYVRKLTMTGRNLYPRFSDDGDTIMFIKKYENQSALGIIRLSHNKSYLFPLDLGKIQSLDW